LLALIQFLEIDRAIAYSILLKSWQAIAGLIGIFLITQYFSPAIQGFYYTFASLVALQTFVELGLYVVISATASHEWAKLGLSENGCIKGDLDSLSRLVSLGRFVFKWYAVGALIFMIFAGWGGYWFLGAQAAPAVNWQLPWFMHVVFSSILLCGMPFLSLLEGCDQIAEVAKFRFWQVFVSNIIFWIAIVTESGLWAAPALSMMSAIICIFYLLVVRRIFFRPFFTQEASKSICWRSEIFPMQWRLALQGLLNYLGFALFTPVMFYYHGPVMAGKMGMSQQILTAMLSIALVWVMTKAPRFAILIAKHKFEVLDIEWKKATLISISLMLVGVIFLFFTLFLLQQINWTPVTRLLPPLTFLMLAVGGIFTVAVQCMAVYLRAHKKEVLTLPGMLTCSLMAVMLLTLGVSYADVGATVSYLFLMSCVMFPSTLYIWQKSRREWHR
jgi:hypothetical protein